MAWHELLRLIYNGQSLMAQSAQRFYFGANHPGVHFTVRETEIVFNLILGRTCKEIARVLRLSPRTIEFYIRNMKKKLRCHTRSELLDSVLNSDFLTNIRIEMHDTAH